MSYRAGLCFLLLVVSGGCRKAPVTPPPPTLPMIPQIQAPMDPAKAFTLPSSGCVVAGKVFYTGRPVKRAVISTGGRTLLPVRLGTEDVMVNADGTMQNVLVYIKEGLSEPYPKPPSRPLLLDANGYRVEPHVLGIQVGQSLVIRNADPDMCIWRFDGKICGPLAFSQPTQGMTNTLSFAAPEIPVRVGSSMFPWMSGYLCVLPHPFYNVTNSGGVFRIENLPPGTYVIEAWHEKFGTNQQTVTVAPDQLVRVQFSYSDKSDVP